MDAAGNLYVVGQFNAATDFGGGTRTPTGLDWLVASFDSNGHHRWSKAFGGTGMDFAGGIAVRAGQVVVMGAFRGRAHFDALTLDAVGSIDMAVVALDADTGTARWAHPLTGPGLGGDVAIAPSGVVVVATPLLGTCNAGGGIVGSAGTQSLLLVGLEPSGGHRWSRTVVAPATAFAMSFDDEVGAVVTLDAGSSPVDFGDGTAVAGGACAVLVVDAANGHEVHAARYGSAGCQPSSIARVAGNYCFAGSQTAADFGTASGAGTGFLACVDRSTLALATGASWMHAVMRVTQGVDGYTYVRGVNTGAAPLLLARESIAPSTPFFAEFSGATPNWARAIIGAVAEAPAGATGTRTFALVAQSGGAVDWGGGTRSGALQIGYFDL